MDDSYAKKDTLIRQRDSDQRAEEEASDATEAVVPPQDVVAFTEQRSCADINRMCEKKQLDINPDFQRGIVWRNRAQTLFIDSLIKQLPIPSMCISLDIKTQNRLVIDGLQRISTINRFLNLNEDWKLADTPDADKKISGKKLSEIRNENPDLFDRVENVTIPITVIRCDYSQQKHMEYLFQIFNRLNSGGNKLYNQEIRNCIYQGPFNSMIKRLARSGAWCEFAKVDEKTVDNARFNNEERILRFFAFYYNYLNYKGKLASFLNDYMHSNKDISDDEVELYTNLFINTLNVANKIKDKPDSKNVVDSVLVGIARNISTLSTLDDMSINNIYDTLMRQPEFSFEEMQEGLGATEKVKNRISKSIEMFSCGR